MKKLTFLCSLLLAIAAPLSAGTVGVTTGYMLDSEDAFFAVHAGEVFAESDTLSHQGELEIGFSTGKDNGMTAKLFPVMLNYRLEIKGSGAWGSYVGLGAGAARGQFEAPVLGRDEGWAAAAQGFAGVSYAVKPNAKLLLGARYLWVDDIGLFGANFEIEDDIVLELGLHVKF